MLTITDYSVELIKDPFGILTGERFEFLLDLEVPEDDELYSVNGIYLRAIYLVEESRDELMKYEIFEKNTDQYLELELEEDELQEVSIFCKAHWMEGKK
ncbi:MAG TPA: DUF6509 family protein [Bacilli bacterium]